MPKKPAFVKHSEIPEGWIIRPGAMGGLKLTYNQVAAPAAAGVATGVIAGAASGAKVLSYDGDAKHGMIGVELQIVSWTHYDGIVYVACVNNKYYRLLLTKIHYARRTLTMSQLISTLAENRNTARI